MSDATSLKNEVVEQSSNKKDSNEKPNITEAIGVCSISGERFKVPETYDCLETLFTPKKWLEIPVLIQIGFIVFYICLLAFTNIPRWFFMISFIFWRLCYNVGLGYILHCQSNYRQFSTMVEKWLKQSPSMVTFFENNVSTKDGKPYKVANYPTDFNAWMAYRALVDLVLGTDLASYLAFCIAYIEAPESIGFFDLFLYVIGFGLCVFNIWAKSDAHRVLGDYAWYWGDFFFLLDKELIFDGIFQMFPHPMYTVGYAFYYGLGLITRSKEVVIVSFCAHMLQLLFLVFVENPHIEKIYGANFAEQKHRESISNRLKQRGYTSGKGKENVLLFNIDLLRASDFILFVATLYIIAFAFSIESTWLHCIHVIFWRLFHNIFLGLLLNAQSLSQFYTRYFEKRGGNKQQAFKSWKRLYNFSLTVNHTAFFTFAMRMLWNEISTGQFPSFTWTIGIQIVVGIILILLNIWQSYSAYEVLGDFGWFYGDFFIDPKDEEIPAKLLYTGIYRYLNNPEIVLGFAAYFGLALISHSLIVFILAIFVQLVNWLFYTLIEKPHMYKIYGKDQMREHGGISSEWLKLRTKIAQSPPFKKIASSPNFASKLEAIPKFEKTIENKISELKKELDILQSQSILFNPDDEFKLRDLLSTTIEKLRNKIKSE